MKRFSRCPACLAVNDAASCSCYVCGASPLMAACPHCGAEMRNPFHLACSVCGEEYAEKGTPRTTSGRTSRTNSGTIDEDWKSP